MPVNTIITLIIGIFGANITLIVALRTLHGSELKKISDDLTRTINEFRTLVKTDCPGLAAAQSAENKIPGLYKSWTRAISWPTWVFAAYIIAFSIIFIFMKWPDSATGEASSNEVTFLIAQHCIWVKYFLGVFLIFNIGCFSTAIYTKRKIFALMLAVERSMKDVKAAGKKSRPGNHSGLHPE